MNFAPLHEELIDVKGTPLYRLTHGSKVVLVQKPVCVLNLAGIRLKAVHDPLKVRPPILGAAERNEVRRRAVIA